MLDSPHSKWFFAKVNEHPRLAHHPLCSCFDNHLIRIGSFTLCLGCTCLSVGAIIAITLLTFWKEQGQVPIALTALLPAWGVGGVLFVPTLIQPFCQLKIFKMCSRACLGVAIVILWYAAILLPEWNTLGVTLRVGFALIFCIVYRITLRFRKRFTADPTATCENGCYPFCGGNERRLANILDRLRDRAEPDDPFVQFAEALIASRDGRFAVPERSKQSGDEKAEGNKTSPDRVGSKS